MYQYCKLSRVITIHDSQKHYLFNIAHIDDIDDIGERF